MTKDERFILKTNIEYYKKLLKKDIADEKRTITEQLLSEANDMLEPNDGRAQ